VIWLCCGLTLSGEGLWVVRVDIGWYVRVVSLCRLLMMLVARVQSLGPRLGWAVRWSWRGSAWAIYVVLGACLSLAYLFLKGTPFHSGPAFNLIGLSSVVAIAVAMRIYRAVQLPWALIALGQAAFVIGDVLAYNYKRFFGVDLPFPSVADAFYLATYPLLIGGLILLVRKRTRAHDRAALIDAVIVSLSAGALSWAILMAPYAHDTSLSVLTKLTSIAYPVMDLAVAACVARLALGAGGRSASLAFLTTGVLFLLGTDSVYGWALLHGGYTTGGLLDGGWIVFYLLLGAAALHPSSTVLVAPSPDRQFRLTRRRITGLAGCAMITPAVLAVEGNRASLGDVTLLAACSGIVFLMVFLRLLDLGRRHQESLRRATLLAAAGAGLIDARTRREVLEVATSAGHELVGDASTIEIGDSMPATTPAAADGKRVVLPLEGRQETHGALLVQGEASVDADTIEGLRTLAHEVALALDGIAMADQLLRQRTEARFQALVQHSSDAILVVDAAGKINYASPSTSRVLDEAPSELERRGMLELVADNDRPRLAQALAADGQTGSMQTLEFQLLSKRGLLEAEAVCTDLVGNDDVRGFVFNIRDVSERKRFERELAHQAFHDELTGLANRALFRDRLEHALERVRRGAAIAVLFVDLDDFKIINDTLGHQVGDQVLRVVGERLSNAARTVDTAARLGGDEFAVLVEDGARVEAERIADRLLQAVSAPVAIDGHELTVSASVGIAVADAAGPSSGADDLLRDADLAMYSAKTTGKGIWRCFEPKMHVILLDRLELKRDLQHALERNEFELHYQPIVDLETGRFVLLEALLRWRHPARGIVPPGDFINIAEETGSIVSIGDWVLREACREAAKLRRLVGEDTPMISVNVSGRQLQERELVARVLAVLAETGMPPEQLVLEITETVMMADVELALRRLQELSAQGIKLAIDDFGSGYSSLNYVRRFPINILKIDRQFIADVVESAEVASLARTILDLAQILELTPIAEGIERSDQLAELRTLGCTLGQGYLFMRAVSAAEIEQEILARAGAELGQPA
jgi:diguanylate cyclase (GGDEF)-like protein/PAS domain S-box-containing protein